MKIKDIGKTITGKTPSTKILDFFGGNIPFVTPEDLTQGFILNNFKRFISENGYKSIKNNTLDGISVLVGCIGSDMGNVAITTGKCATNQQINAITNFSNDVNPFYVYYYLSNQKKYLRQIAGMTTTPILPKSIFDEIDIPIFEKSIQDKIVGILIPIDRKIKNNLYINEVLKSYLNTLYEYWFLQYDFPNENGKPYKSSGGKMVWNEELKREIPEGWKVSKIGDILEEANKSKIKVNDAKEKGKYPFFTSGEKILCYDDYLVKGFNIFLNTGGNPDIKAYMGKCAYSTDTWCVSAKEYSYILFYYLLKLMPQFEQLFFAGSGLKHLQKDSLKNQYILLPDEKVLRNFNNICELIWKKITNCLIENQELVSLRDFLLPLLMNGQVKFKDN